MGSIEQRLEYLEEANDVLRMQNHVLSTAFKALIRALPAETAEIAVESIQLAFEDALAELSYEDSPIPICSTTLLMRFSVKKNVNFVLN